MQKRHAGHWQHLSKEANAALMKRFDVTCQVLRSIAGRLEGQHTAIELLNKAMCDYPADGMGAQWAWTRMNLGNAYRYRLTGEKRDNIELAIGHCEAALEVLTREAFPENWAWTRMNLGIMYWSRWSRLAGEKRDNLELALGHFEAALEVYTREAFAKDWAILCMNLGNVYGNRLVGEKRENIELAIGYLEAALEVLTREALPDKWARTYMSLGSAYWSRLAGENRDNIELAIGHCKAALEVLTREAFPEDWARTRMNLGAAYQYRLAGEKRSNIELAIGHYETALEVLTREALPVDWARARMNLGTAYYVRSAGEKRGNIELAIGHYEAALEVLTREAFTEMWASVCYNLGLAYSKHPDDTDENAAVAIQHFADVLAQTVELERTAHDAEARRTIRQQTFQCHSHLVQLYMRRNNPVAALVATEASRARGLADLVSSSDSSEADGAPTTPERTAYRNALQQLQLASRAYEVAARMALHEEGALAVPRANLTSARARLAAAQAVMEKQDPTFSALRSPPALVLADIKAALGERTVAVVWYMTAEWAGAFVMAAILDTPRVVVYDDLDSIREVIGRYKAVVAQGVPGDASAAAAELATVLRLSEIRDHMTGKGMLVASHPFLVLVPHSNLHAIPLATLPLNGEPNGTTFTDHFTSGVFTVPSFHLLQQARGTVQPLQLSRLVAVQDPTCDLPMASVEVEQVRRRCAMTLPAGENAHDLPGTILLQSTACLKGHAATRDAILSTLSEGHVSTVLHCACHGSVDAADSWSSGLRLAGGSNLTVRDVLQQPGTFRHVELCLLSACETALHDGVTEWTDECVGFASVLLAVGVPRVLAALWRVDDTATALLVTKLYDELLQTGGLKDAGAALRAAQYWLRTLTTADVDRMVEEQHWPDMLKQRWRTSRVRSAPDVLSTQLWVLGATEQGQPPVGALDAAALLPDLLPQAHRNKTAKNMPSFKLDEWAQFTAAFCHRADRSRVASFELVYSHLFPSRVHGESRLCCERGCWFRYRMAGDTELDRVVVLHVHYLTPWGEQPLDDVIGNVNVRGAALGSAYQYEPHPLLKSGIMATGESLKLMSLLPEECAEPTAKGKKANQANVKGKKSKAPGTLWSMWKSKKPQQAQPDGNQSCDASLPAAPLDAVSAWQPAVETQLRQAAANALMEYASPGADTHEAHIDSLIARLHAIRDVLAFVRDKTAAVVPVMLDGGGQVGEVDHEMALAAAPDYKPFASPRYWAAFVLMGVEGETADKADDVATNRGDPE